MINFVNIDSICKGLEAWIIVTTDCYAARLKSIDKAKLKSTFFSYHNVKPQVRFCISWTTNLSWMTSTFIRDNNKHTSKQSLLVKTGF